MVLRRVGSDDDDDVRVLTSGEGRGHGGGADALHQRRHGRRVAKPGAMVHVVGAEARAHELLHEVGLLVGTLGRAVTRQGGAAVPVPYVPETRGRRVQCLLPGGLAEVAVGIRRVDVRRGILGRVVAAYERYRETVRVADVVEAEPALDAQAAVIGRPVAALHRDDGVVLDPVIDLTTHAAIGTHAGHRREGLALVHAGVVHHRRGGQGAGGAGLHAFTAGHARALAHGVVEVEDDLGVAAAVGHADDVVHLHLAAGAHAQGAVDARVEGYPHGRMAAIGSGGVAGREPAARHLQALGPLPQTRPGIVRGFPGGLVRHQQLKHHPARIPRPLAVRAHLHAGGRTPDARCGQHALSLHFHHARATVAIRPVARLRVVAQVRDHRPLPLGHLPEGLAGRLHLLAVEGKPDGLAHDRSSRK